MRIRHGALRAVRDRRCACPQPGWPPATAIDRFSGPSACRASVPPPLHPLRPVLAKPMCPPRSTAHALPAVVVAVAARARNLPTPAKLHDRFRAGTAPFAAPFPPPPVRCGMPVTRGEGVVTRRSAMPARKGCAVSGAPAVQRVGFGTHANATDTGEITRSVPGRNHFRGSGASASAPGPPHPSEEMCRLTSDATRSPAADGSLQVRCDVL